MRLVVIGGSGTSTPELVDALVAWPDAATRRPSLQLVLQGRSADRLALVTDACRARLPADTRGIGISSETDLDLALDGADVVLVQVRVGGFDARAFDETFPRAFGIPGEETQGPGGFANAMRTVPNMARIWERLAVRAPGAFLINLTNPSGIVTAAMRRRFDANVVSVCDTPVTFVDAIGRATGLTPDAVRAHYIGMNHAGFWAGPDLDTMLAALPATSGIDHEDVERLGALPMAYLRFYLHPDRQLTAQFGLSETRAQALKRLAGEMLRQYAAGVKPGQHPRRRALWYAASIVPLLDAVVYGSDQTMVLGLPNAGSVDWAPAEAIVELPTWVRRRGSFERAPVADLPGPAADLLRRHAAYETRAADVLSGVTEVAELGAQRDALADALAENPMVATRDLAGRIVDTIIATSP